MKVRFDTSTPLAGTVPEGGDACNCQQSLVRPSAIPVAALSKQRMGCRFRTASSSSAIVNSAGRTV